MDQQLAFNDAILELDDHLNNLQNRALQLDRLCQCTHFYEPMPLCDQKWDAMSGCCGDQMHDVVKLHEEFHGVTWLPLSVEYQHGLIHAQYEELKEHASFQRIVSLAVHGEIPHKGLLHDVDRKV